ncbi:hypothetical protein NNC19_13575 [Clostridium sp. SHJSY1]|uniref:hypothetical protein n=1 Tax=Clostridium sp. SHJSY1 TaxID=2942483 RepID=UPI002877090C|nr:hypothetical protein [Clostridium sp. SHJSY1]MDS0526716.1 hypothetical protein [Clostridium sp. SHJSY1]
MKRKFMFIISILLWVVAAVILWEGNNHVLGITLLMISILLNLIRQLLNSWSELRHK